MQNNALPARFLAALVDYFIVSSTAYLLPLNPSLGFFLLSAFYFTVCNKQGFSLGKALFGLRITKFGAERGLAWGESLLRFFLLYGLPLIITEVPRYFFSQSGFSAPIYFLELNFFFSLAYAGSLLAETVRSGFGWHDRSAGSQVFRLDAAPAKDQKTPVSFNALSLSLVLAFGLWFLGLSKHPEVSEIISKKYQLSLGQDFEIHDAAFSTQPKETLVLRLISQNATLSEESLKAFLQTLPKTSAKVIHCSVLSSENGEFKEFKFGPNLNPLPT